MSAAFNPNDPSWNSAGQSETHNWAGAIGANVAALLFQAIGLAAYLLPCLFLAAAWRRFRTLSIRAPFSSLLGLVLLTLAAASLLSISNIHPIFDASVQPGGVVGTLISRGLASGLNTVGATILLIAVAATGLLLATNFSFVGLYEKLVSMIAERFAGITNIPARFHAWREARAAQKLLRKEQRDLIKAQKAAAVAALKGSPELSPEARIAQFMKEGAQGTIDADAINRGEPAGVNQVTTIQASAEPSRAAAAGAGVSGAVVGNASSGRRSISPGSKSAVADDEAEAEEMIKGASVFRPKGEAPATGKLPFDADRARRVAYTEYSMPPLGFLNEAPPPSEQADTELLGLATRLALSSPASVPAAH